MRRSSSKLITRARSVRNMGKVPFKFKFDLLVETVEKLAASGDVVVVWERSNNKADATKAAKIDRTTRKATFANERITSEITLFKTQPSERKFQDKVVKLAIKANNIDGKTLGKIHLNLADYAEVPSGSKRISAELTNGSTLIASIQCVFLSMGKTAPGKAGGKSEASDSGDELADDMDSDSRRGAIDDTPSSFLKNKLKLNQAHSKKTSGRLEKRCKDDENNWDASNGTDGGTIDRLKKENARLKKQIEESSCSSDGKLSDENKKLKIEIRDLQTALSREPVYADVVRELKEAKMALAFLHLEKEKVLLELMKYQRGELSPSKTSR